MQSKHEVKRLILAALEQFAEQRPGIESGNYGSPADYRREARAVTQDLAHARTLLAAADQSSVTAEYLTAAGYGGRLDIRPVLNTTYYGLAPEPLRYDVQYTTGQYFATEYRKAVCNVLARALWDYRYRRASTLGCTRGSMYAHFRREFGRAIADRYFT
jgi:hypothetical protein